MSAYLSFSFKLCNSSSSASVSLFRFFSSSLFSFCVQSDPDLSNFEKLCCRGLYRRNKCFKLIWLLFSVFQPPYHICRLLAISRAWTCSIFTVFSQICGQLSFLWTGCNSDLPKTCGHSPHISCTLVELRWKLLCFQIHSIKQHSAADKMTYICYRNHFATLDSSESISTNLYDLLWIARVIQFIISSNFAFPPATYHDDCCKYHCILQWLHFCPYLGSGMIPRLLH